MKISESNLSNSSVDDEYYDHESRLEDLENKHEYLENMSRRNNVKLLGLPEDKNREKSWENTDKIVKEMINKELEITSEEIQLERAHPPREETPRWPASTSGSKILFLETKRSHIGYCQKKEA